MFGKKVWIACLVSVLFVALPRVAAAEEGVALDALRSHD